MRSAEREGVEGASPKVLEYVTILRFPDSLENRMTTGFYARLRDTRKDDDALAACIDRVVKQLEDTSTTGDRPGILLGKIQSGKFPIPHAVVRNQ